MYAPNIITKITSNGTTVCVVSSMGDIFSFSLADLSSHASPSDLAKRIRPQRIWSLRRRHMAVRDVAVGQDGTVIISTESGSVWTRVRRAKPKAEKGTCAVKEFKFARVGGLTRVVAVRANVAGAYAAIRNDVEIPDVVVEESCLGEEMLMMIPLGETVHEIVGEEKDDSSRSEDDDGADVPCVQDFGKPWNDLFEDMIPNESCDTAFVVQGGQRLHFHKAMLVCRSVAFREFLSTPESTAFTFEITDDGMEIDLKDVGIAAAAQLLHYVYTDKVIQLPEFKNSRKAERLTMIRELRILASRFKLKLLADTLTSSWYLVQIPPTETLQRDLKSLMSLPATLTSPDVILVLCDREVHCHSFILAARCPFFHAMLDTAGLGGGWVARRRQIAFEEGLSEFRIQLKHLPYSVMALILEHIYYDAQRELFDSIRKETSDEFLEFVIEVMAVANELLLDRLKDICQSILAQFSNIISNQANASHFAQCGDNTRGSGYICRRTTQRRLSGLLRHKRRSPPRESVLPARHISQ
jgi:inhibitor of Bruton tyrosine kinase